MPADKRNRFILGRPTGRTLRAATRSSACSSP